MIKSPGWFETKHYDTKTINNVGEELDIMRKGRHDPRIFLRTMPIVESIAVLVVLDLILSNKTSKVNS